MTAAQWALNIAMYANPVGLIILGIVALIAILAAVAYAVWKFRDAILDGLGAAWNWIKDNWPLLLAILTGPFGLAIWAIWKFRDQIFDVILGIFNRVKGLWNDLLGIFGLGGDSEVTVNANVNRINTGAPQPPVLGFAEGGVVPGAKGAAVPAIVHGGETVLPAGPLRGYCGSSSCQRGLTGRPLWRRAYRGCQDCRGCREWPTRRRLLLPSLQASARLWRPSWGCQWRSLHSPERGPLLAQRSLARCSQTCNWGRRPSRLRCRRRCLRMVAVGVPSPWMWKKSTSMSGRAPTGQEIAATIARQLSDQIEDLVGDFDGPIVR